jgi:hypothetical protein
MTDPSMAFARSQFKPNAENCKNQEFRIQNSLSLQRVYGGRDRTRTCDLLRVKQAL